LLASSVFTSDGSVSRTNDLGRTVIKRFSGRSVGTSDRTVGGVGFYVLSKTGTLRK